MAIDKNPTLVLPAATGLGMRLPTQKKVGYFEELGHTGLLQYGGWIQEEFLSELTGARWNRIVKEMTTNDPVVHAMFFIVELLTRAVTWEIKAGEEGQEGDKRADFIKSNLDDMSQSWKDLISEILSFLPWGFDYHEIVYKQRNGENPGTFTDLAGREVEMATSKYDDGLIGWRKMPTRSQDSVEHWVLDEHGGIQGLWQNTLFSRNFIPIDKSLLFRTSISKNNPEGRSLCRRIYRPWFFKMRIENIEGIGIERDLAGLPKGKIPSDYLKPDANPNQKAIAEDMKRILMNIRNDDQAALLLPSDLYEGTSEPMFDVTLLSTAGSRVFDTNKIIQRYDIRILMILMVDFLLLGHEKVGSFALASSKTELFSIALGGFLDVIADTFNRHAIPKLLKLNGMPTEKAPELVHGDVETIDLKELADLVSKVSGTKITLSDDEQDWVLEQSGMPVVKGTREKMRKESEQKAAELAKQIAAGDAGAPSPNGGQPGKPGTGKPTQDGAPGPSPDNPQMDINPT